MRYLVLVLGVLFLLATESRGQSPASSGTIITIAGGAHGYSGDGGPATNAAMGDGVWAMDFGPDGTLYFADHFNARIRAIDPVSRFVRTVAGNGTFEGNGGLGDGGLATNASFGGVFGLAVDPMRRALYFSDDANNRVRQVNLNTGIISAFAGIGILGFGSGGDGGPAVEAEFALPKGLALNHAGHLTIADQNNFRIRVVNPVTQVISRLAGLGDMFNPPCSKEGDGGPALDAKFSLPIEVSTDGAGNVFVLDAGGPCGPTNLPTTLRRIDAASGLITTVAGGGTNTIGNGVATHMDLAQVFSHTVDREGNLYVATYTRIFKVDSMTGLLSVYAGTGAQAFSGDGGPAIAAEFGRIFSMAPAPGGGLVVGDSGNARLRYIAPDSIKLTNDSGQTSFPLPWLSSLTGNFIVENNPNLTNINVGNLTNVGGVILVQSNVNVGVLDLGGVQSADTVSVSGNTAAGVLDLGSLATVSGDLILEGNTSVGNLDLGSLESAGNVSVSGNTAAGELDLGSLTTVSGDLTLEGNTAASVVNLASLASVSGDLSIEGNTSAGNLELGSLAEVSGDLTITSNAPSGNLDLSSLTGYGCGTNEVTMTLNVATVELTNGLTLCTNATLTGSTTIDGSVTNNGTIEPGSSPGQLNITGNLHLSSASRLHLEIGGYSSNQFDIVNVGGAATLGGTLTVTLLNNFTNAMTNGASFTVLTAGPTLTGSFANVASGATLVTADGRARFTVRYAGENTLRLTNLEILGPVPASSSTVITVAGNGSPSFSGDGGPATNASLDIVEGLAFGNDGTLYIGDSGNVRIRAIDPVTGVIRTIAGTGVSGEEGNDGPATNATLGGVIGLATDRSRNALYITDWPNNWVRKVNLNDGIITRYAGSGNFGFTGDGGPATLAKLRIPISAGTDAAGRLSFIDLHNYRVRRVDPVTGIITTIAGSGIAAPLSGPTGDGGPATSATFGSGLRLTADPAGNVFLRDGDPNGTYFTVRRIDATTGIINTIVGGGTNAPGTGFATNMFFNNIAEVAANDAGELFVATPYQVFKLNIASGIIAPFAGNGTKGLGNEGDPALNAMFASITAQAVAPGGGLVIADTDNARVRYVTPDSIKLTNDNGQISFTLPWVSGLAGDLILQNNPNLTNINVGNLTNVGGVVSIGGNTAAGVLDLSSLLSAGTVEISGNTAAGVISLSELGTVAGEVNITGNTSAGVINLGSLQSAGTVEISGNTAAGVISLGELGTVSGEITVTENSAAGVVDLSSLQSSGTVEISGNTAAGVISLGELGTVAGEVIITDNTNASVVDLSSLADASGDVTIESNATDVVVNLSSLTTYGCGTNEVTLTLDGGTVEMTNGLTLCTNATLTGTTTMDGSVTNNGTIEPGSSPGRLNLTGNLHLNSPSRLHLEIGGYGSNQFDVVSVGGNVTLGGNLTVRLLNSFTDGMTNGASFTVLTAGGPLAGSFANVASGATLVTADGRARFTVRYAGENTLRLTDLEILNSGNGDTDGDGLPDEWEDRFGLGKTNAADAELDLDGDGASNRNEFIAGTIPDNPSSVFRIVSIEREAAAVRITWSTVGGKSYRVQTNTPTATGGISTNFADFTPVIQMPGTGDSTTNLLDTPPVGETRYYRVRITP